MPVAALHALGAIFFALTLANGPDDVLLSKDKINGTTALASICHSFSCGFFLFDVIVVLHHDPFDVKFFLHAIVCGAAYWLAQKPLFQYFTVRFLFYEISTPLIYVRMYLVLSKAPKMLTNLVGYMFGVAFIGCRLIYGLPLSYDFVMYLLHLIKDRPQQCLSSSIKNNDCVGFEGLPNDTILYFCIFAVCSMAALNVLWFVITLVSPPQPDELHEGAKIKVPKAPNHPQNNSTRKQKKN